MRRLAVLAVLVPLAAACGGHAKSSGSGTVSHWVSVEHLPKQAIPGAAVFAAKGCTACHTYAGSGSSNLNAPDLTSIGTRNLGIRFQIAHLKCPSCVNPGSPMPPFRSLGPVRLHQLAVFLEASRGTH
jgi:mono/diheme cytochrome c family protein